MGLYGSVLLYPELHRRKGFKGFFLRGEIPEQALLDDPADVLSKILRCFIYHGFLDEPASIDMFDPQYFSGHILVLEGNKALRHVHKQIPPTRLKPKISEFVFAVTPREIEGEMADEDAADDLFVPTIDLVIFQQIASFTDSNPSDRYAEGEVESWAFIEFGFEDFRFTEEVHSLRNPEHPIMQGLGDIFHSRMNWGRIYW